MSQEPITVTYSLQEIFGEIKESIKEVNSKLDKLDEKFEDKFNKLDEKITKFESTLTQQMTKVEATLQAQQTSIQKIPDLAEKVGELKNWRQIVIILITGSVTGFIGWLIRGGNLRP